MRSNVEIVNLLKKKKLNIMETNVLRTNDINTNENMHDIHNCKEK